MKQPKTILRINPHTRKAYITYTRKARAPLPLKPAPIFQVRGVSNNKYRRKRNLQPYTRTGQMMYSPVFANKPVQYVAVLIGHGSSRDSSSMSERIEGHPLFNTKYDLIFVTPHGTVASSHGPPQSVFGHLCNSIQSPGKPYTGKPCTGAQLMNALQSTIRSPQGPHVQGQLFKTTTLKQHDTDSSVSDLNIFGGGYTKNLLRIDGIYLFEVGKSCDEPDNHNVLTVNPTSLVNTHPDLRYVAQTATHLQTFIEPTETHVRVVGTRMVGTKKVLEYLFEPQYQIKGNADRPVRPVHLSDVLEHPGIFPEHTAVIAYVCRGISTLQSKDQPYDSAVSADYTTATASSASSASSLGDAAAVSAVSALSDDADNAAFDGWDSSTASRDDAFSWDGSIGSDMGGSMKKRAKFKKTLKMRRS
jgi:hypothetical protein